jgi:hypothetical protein
MGFLLDTVDRKKLDTQREVVGNERRQSIDNAPYARAEERLVQLLYPKPSPYNGHVIGSFENLSKGLARRGEELLPHLLCVRQCLALGWWATSSSPRWGRCWRKSSGLGSRVQRIVRRSLRSMW